MKRVDDISKLNLHQSSYTLCDWYWSISINARWDPTEVEKLSVHGPILSLNSKKLSISLMASYLYLEDGKEKS